jgi:transcriptional regulator GlxA family with amidase domain
LTISLHHQPSILNQLVQKNATIYDLPPFYKEFQKRLRSHFIQTGKPIAPPEESRPLEVAFMQKINALIKVNIDNENFDTKSLCKTMSLSRTQLFRRIKSLIKQAPANYIKTIRLQRAKELLEATDCTVSEIAFKTGFQTISHLTKVFKMQYGTAPSVFRLTK